MKILHINTTDGGGAAKALTRLHEGLIAKNIQSKVLTLYHQTDSYKKQIYPFLNGHHSLLDKAKYSILYRFDSIKKKQLLQNTQKNYEVFSFPFTAYDLHKHPLVKEADILHLHWVGGFLDYKTFFEKINKPVIWTLHDLNPFSGGFHYEEDSLNNREDFSKIENQYLVLKKKAISSTKNLHIVCLSQWIQKMSKNSNVFNELPHHLIPNGLNLQTFRPQNENRDKICKKFNLPLDKKIILFVADNIHNQRKGFAYLKQALEYLKNKDFVCLLVGKSDNKQEEVPFLHLDFIKNEEMLAEIYASADVYVIPSLEDNLPNTVLESLACGTPVVGFEVGGIPDMVRNEQNGFLAELKNSKDFARKIQQILENDELRMQMSQNARKIAEEEYSLELQTKRYIELYQSIRKE